MTLSSISNRHKLVDCIFLFLVALLPFLPAVYHLGFHDDDWQNLGVLVRHSNGTLMEMARALIDLDPHFGFRPIQLTFLIADYKFFGLNSTEYYVCLAVIVAFTPLTVYLMMLEIPLDRWLAFSTALIFAFLPHYATDRFWVSTQQANFCIAFACLGLFALLRSTTLEGRQSVLGVVIGTVMILLSFLSYEVALGLIVVGFIYAASRAWLKMKDSSNRNRAPFISFIAVTTALLVLGLIKTRSQNMLVYHHNFGKLLERLGWVIERALTQAVKFNCWIYGLHMPVALAKMAKLNALTVPSLVTALLVGMLVSFYMWKFVQYSPAISVRNACLLFAAAFAIFWLGYILFAFNRDQDFNVAGLANRVTIASALGVPLVELAVLALLCGVFHSKYKVVIFSCGVGAVCAINCLATLGIAWFWQDAARKRDAIIESFSTHVPA